MSERRADCDVRALAENALCSLRYNRALIRACRYSAPHEDCEHVAFHRCVREQHNATIFVAPRMLVEYDLPCDPGPFVDPKTCHEDPRIAREIADHRARRAALQGGARR